MIEQLDAIIKKQVEGAAAAEACNALAVLPIVFNTLMEERIELAVGTFLLVDVTEGIGRHGSHCFDVFPHEYLLLA
jgi:hypothetical protein